MNFERNIGVKKSAKIGLDAWAFKPNTIIWMESKKPAHDWWIKTLLSGKRKNYCTREIFLQAHKNQEGPLPLTTYPQVGYSLTYLRVCSEYKYVLWKGTYYEL